MICELSWPFIISQAIFVQFWYNCSMQTDEQYHVLRVRLCLYAHQHELFLMSKVPFHKILGIEIMQTKVFMLLLWITSYSPWQLSSYVVIHFKLPLYHTPVWYNIVRIPYFYCLLQNSFSTGFFFCCYLYQLSLWDYLWDSWCPADGACFQLSTTKTGDFDIFISTTLCAGRG